MVVRVINKQEIKVFVSDARWRSVEDVFKNYLDDLLDIKNIDLKDEPEVVKAQIKVRLELKRDIEKMLSEFGMLKEEITVEKPSFK